jgi:hypothetical protein
MTVFDDGRGPALYAAGAFEIAGRTTAHNIAKWDGTQWSPLLPGGSDDSVAVLAVYDDGSGPALYLGGSFSNAGGVPVNNICKWSGTVFSEIRDASG